jgi:acyl carrier protein
MAHRPGLTEANIEEWCRAYLAKTLKRTPGSIDRQATFDSLGLDSAESVFLVAALEDWSGLELASDTAIEHHTLAVLSRFIVEMVGQASLQVPSG